MSPVKIDILPASAAADLTLVSAAAVTSDTGLLETCSKEYEQGHKKQRQLRASTRCNANKDAIHL
jgi:hypothetical protein